MRTAEKLSQKIADARYKMAVAMTRAERHYWAGVVDGLTAVRRSPRRAEALARRAEREAALAKERLDYAAESYHNGVCAGIAEGRA